MKTSILFLILSCTLAFARLGENENQCNGRYGTPHTDKVTLSKNQKQPLLPIGYTKTYNYQGWKIRIAYIEFNGPAIKLSFRKKTGGSIKEDELVAILTANTLEGMKWERGVYTNSPLKGTLGVYGNIGSNAMGAGAWKRTDGAAATLDPLKLELVLETPAAIETSKKAKAEKETERKATIPTF